jgi:hypothetical protein
MVGQMVAEQRDQGAGHRHVTAARGGLGGADDDTAARADGDPADTDHSVGQVEVAAAQLDQLPVPEGAPGGEEHPGPVPRWHRGDQGLELVQGRGPDSLDLFGVPGPAYVARIGGYLPVVDGGLQDGAQQPVRVGSQRRPGGVEAGVPLADGGRGDVA